jgi:branched-chain amino acid transport system permease protein
LNYLFNTLSLISIYIILALSLNLVVGYTGLLSLCHAAFYGVGAYASTLLMLRLGMGYLPALALSAIGSMVLSLAISIPSLRLKGDYFVLASICFQVIVYSVIYNWMPVTKGPYGIGGIPRPTPFGLSIDTHAAYFVFVAAVTVIAVLLLNIVAGSPFGRVLRAIREDEIAVEALGKNVPLFKMAAFALAAAFAALSGTLFAGLVGYIDPTSFALAESMFILSIVIIGGSGNLAGPLSGAVLLIVLPEVLRFLRVPDALAANLRQVIYGLAIIVVMRFRPQGLFGKYRFE